jgi:hypothetical protein
MLGRQPCQGPPSAAAAPPAPRLEPHPHPAPPLPPPRPTKTRSAALLQLLCAYADRYDALLEGRCEDMSLSELHGGARIRWGAGGRTNAWGLGTGAVFWGCCLHLPLLPPAPACSLKTHALTHPCPRPPSPTHSRPPPPGTCSWRCTAASCACWTPRATWGTTTCAPRSRTAAARAVRRRHGGRAGAGGSGRERAGAGGRAGLPLGPRPPQPKPLSLSPRLADARVPSTTNTAPQPPPQRHPPHPPGAL